MWYDYYMKKIGLFFLIAALILIGGFYAFNSWIYKEKQGDGSEIQAYRASLSGEYVCLVAEGEEPTEECTPGLRTEVGEYYALNFALSSQIAPTVEVGDQMSAQGMVTPIEMLSTDHWQKYNVEGIFSVTDSVEVQ